MSVFLANFLAQTIVFFNNLGVPASLRSPSLPYALPIGHPLFNDDRYGGSEVLKGTIFTKYKEFVHNCFKLIPRQSLHAKTLGFVHPRTGEEVFFDSELPNDFKQVMAKWRVYLNARKGQIQQEIADSDVVYDDINHMNLK